MMIEWKPIVEKIKEINQQLAKHLGVEAPDSSKITEAADHIFNPIEALDADQIKVLNEIKTLQTELEKLAEVQKTIDDKSKRLDNLQKFFTSGVELKHNLSNQVWRINENTSMIEVFDKEKASQEMKEMGFDGFLGALGQEPPSGE